LRLSKDCYYFKEYVLVQRGQRYCVLASFLTRQGISKEAGSVSPCGKRLPQVRLYRWINDKKVVLKDSIFIDAFTISLGNASDFDGSGTTKFIVNQICSVPHGQSPSLLCYAFSVYEITKKEKFRSTLVIGNVPERYLDGHAAGIPLEPVVTGLYNKTDYPECLAIDDFFEGDPAFRSDDFPKVTLVYTWDKTGAVYKNHSEKFPARFGLPARVDSLPVGIPLVEFMQTALQIAAAGNQKAARMYIALGMTPERFAEWKEKAGPRADKVDLERLRTKLLTCIERYKTNP
ncbi:MAG: hypothetical protein ABI623_04845, partial [bacterium]